MAHASKQIKDWFADALNSTGNLPVVIEDAQPQIDANSACVLRYDREEIEQGDVHDDQLRTLTIEVVLTHYDRDLLDAMSVYAETPLQTYVISAYPGIDRPRLILRDYDADRNQDRAVYSCTLTYECVYYVGRSDPETITN